MSEQVMNDRQMLYVAYGAILAMASADDTNEQALVELLEEHLFSEKESAHPEATP